MQVLVHVCIGDKEHSFQGDAPIFDTDKVEDVEEFSSYGFFLFAWKELARSETRPRKEWAFFPWSSCWVEKKGRSS